MPWCILPIPWWMVLSSFLLPLTTGPKIKQAPLPAAICRSWRAWPVTATPVPDAMAVTWHHQVVLCPLAMVCTCRPCPLTQRPGRRHQANGGLGGGGPHTHHVWGRTPRSAVAAQPCQGNLGGNWPPSVDRRLVCLGYSRVSKWA